MKFHKLLQQGYSIYKVTKSYLMGIITKAWVHCGFLAQNPGHNQVFSISRYSKQKLHNAEEQHPPGPWRMPVHHSSGDDFLYWFLCDQLHVSLPKTRLSCRGVVLALSKHWGLWVIMVSHCHLFSGDIPTTDFLLCPRSTSICSSCPVTLSSVSSAAGTPQRRTPWHTRVPAVGSWRPASGRWRCSALTAARSHIPTSTSRRAGVTSRSVTRACWNSADGGDRQDTAWCLQLGLSFLDWNILRCKSEECFICFSKSHIVFGSLLFLSLLLILFCILIKFTFMSFKFKFGK